MKKTAAVLCALLIAAGARATAAPALTSAEQSVIVRLICAETDENDPFVCRVAAAAIVLNRMESAEYPDDAVSVIYASGAFPGVSDNTINSAAGEDEVLEAHRALILALTGRDPTCGAVVMARRGSAEAEKIDVTFSAGSMVFGMRKSGTDTAADNLSG